MALRTHWHGDTTYISGIVALRTNQRCSLSYISGTKNTVAQCSGTSGGKNHKVGHNLRLFFYSQWSTTTKNPYAITGPLVHSFACSLNSFVRSLAGTIDIELTGKRFLFMI